MRILLTGASGFTGSHFKLHADQAGHEVVPLNADLTDPVSVQKGVKETGPVDAVVHLAAISFVGHANDAEFYAVNTVGTTHLLAALAAQPAINRPYKVLAASSANVYGNCQHSPIAETQPLAPVNHYAASKLAMEHMAKTYTDRLPIIITRPFNYTGPGQSSEFLVPKLVDHFIHRKDSIELGNLEIAREFNDVGFVVQAYLDLLCAGQPGETYNICTGTSHKLSDVLNMLTELTGHNLKIEKKPHLIRNSEIMNLTGDPTKLKNTLPKLNTKTLRVTLAEMLSVTK